MANRYKISNLNVNNFLCGQGCARNEAAEQANTALANGEISKEQYDALQREIIETENDLKKLTEYKQQESITVRYFDSETIAVKQTQMYVEGFKSKLEKDTSYKGLWMVSFVLKEF